MNDERYAPNQPYLEKVSARIGRAVMAFYFDRVGRHAFQFHAEDLHCFVEREVNIAAPASADRILRDLRQKGKLDYDVLDRAKSLYEFKKEQGELFDERDSNQRDAVRRSANHKLEAIRENRAAN
jgi:hypothetical protein